MGMAETMQRMVVADSSWPYRDEKQELRDIIEAQKKEIRRLQREVQDLKRRRRR